MKKILPMMMAWAAAVMVPLALADDYSSGWSLPLGAQAPAIEAPDQTGAVRTLDSLAGERGLLLFLSRSADW